MSSGSRAWIVAASMGAVEALKDQGFARWNYALRMIQQQAKSNAVRSYSQATRLSSPSSALVSSKIREEKLKKSEESLRTVMKQSVDRGGQHGSCGGLEGPRLRKVELRFEDDPTTCQIKPQALFSGYERPKKRRSLDDAAVKVSAEEYEYEIFQSPEEYKKANLEPPRYDLPEKYTPQRAAVTVAVTAPLPETSSRGTMRSFPVSARPPAPAKKISLGSKKIEPVKPTDPSAEALIPTRLPLAATHPSGQSGDHGDARTTKRGKEKETEEVEEDGDEIHRREVAPLKKALAKRDQRIKELEGKLKTVEETGRRILERADLGEKILTDPVLLARHICRGRETGEAVLAAISRTPVGEDLMYEFEEVPDPGPTPFSSVPEGRNLPVPVVEVSAGPSAEAAATTRPMTESRMSPSAGPSAEGDAEPRVVSGKEAN
nr:hypothetical protein CDL12_20247 [Ipomoea batatas]